MIKAQILLGYHFYMFAIQNLLPKKYRRLDCNMQHIHVCLQDTLGYVLVTLNADMDNIVTTQCVTSLPTTVIVDVRSIFFLLPSDKCVRRENLPRREQQSVLSKS